MKVCDHASSRIRRVPCIFRYSGGEAIDIRQVLDATESPKRCSRQTPAPRERRCCVTRREDLAVLAPGVRRPAMRCRRLHHGRRLHSQVARRGRLWFLHSHGKRRSPSVNSSRGCPRVAGQPALTGRNVLAGSKCPWPYVIWSAVPPAAEEQ
jgi:hypothetical protein